MHALPNQQLQPTPKCNAALRGLALHGAAELRRGLSPNSHGGVHIIR